MSKFRKIVELLEGTWYLWLPVVAGYVVQAVENIIF